MKSNERGMKGNENKMKKNQSCKAMGFLIKNHCQKFESSKRYPLQVPRVHNKKEVLKYKPSPYWFVGGVFLDMSIPPFSSKWKKDVSKWRKVESCPTSKSQAFKKTIPTKSVIQQSCKGNKGTMQANESRMNANESEWQQNGAAKGNKTSAKWKKTLWTPGDNSGGYPKILRKKLDLIWKMYLLCLLRISHYAMCSWSLSSLKIPSDGS